MIFLRETNESDLALMLAWRNNPLCYAGYYQQTKPISWETHLAWWRSRSSDWARFIVMCIEDNISRPIGILNFNSLSHWSPEIGYTIGEVTLWNKGIGTEAVRLGIEWIQKYAETHKHITGIHTTIKDDNKSSVKVVKKLGFKIGMEARQGEHYWIRNLKLS